MGKRPAGSGVPPEQETVVFRLGGSSFRMDMALVQSVVKPKAVTPCAREGSCVCGLVNVKGRTVPVYDICDLLETGQRSRETAKSRIIVAEGEHGAVAFVVDAVTNALSEKGKGTAAVDAPLVDIDAALERRHLV